MVQQICSWSWLLTLEKHAVEALKKQIFLGFTTSHSRAMEAGDMHKKMGTLEDSHRGRKASFLEFSKPPAMVEDVENRYITSFQFLAAINLL